jgi:ADP-ribose pyrophosphatase YjhB (NUDIX family)
MAYPENRRANQRGTMDYISSLRQLVGHMPLVLAGTTILVLNERNELLMLRRSDCGDWGLPGGLMEPGETTEQTARRELLEETGQTADGLELFGVFSGPEHYFRYPNGDEAYHVSIVYLTRTAHGHVKLSDGEHTDFGYFALSALPTETGSPIRPILKKLSESLTR